MTNFFGRRNKREKTYIIGRGWQGRERKTLLAVFRVLNRGFYKGRKIQNIFWGKTAESVQNPGVPLQPCSLIKQR